MTSLIDRKADIVADLLGEDPADVRDAWRAMAAAEREHDRSWFRYSVHLMPTGRWAVLYANELEMAVFDIRAEAEAYLDELNRH